MPHQWAFNGHLRTATKPGHVLPGFGCALTCFHLWLSRFTFRVAGYIGEAKNGNRPEKPGEIPHLSMPVPESPGQAESWGSRIRT